MKNLIVLFLMISFGASAQIPYFRHAFTQSDTIMSEIGFSFPKPEASIKKSEEEFLLNMGYTEHSLFFVEEVDPETAQVNGKYNVYYLDADLPLRKITYMDEKSILMGKFESMHNWVRILPLDAEGEAYFIALKIREQMDRLDRLAPRIIHKEQK